MEDILKIIEPISWLKGKWQGHGNGGFPTMDTFEFTDQMDFRILPEAFNKEPLIRFDEIAWLIKNGNHDFMHWETGFFKPLSNGSIQFYVSHNTGRMEVTIGKFTSIDIKSKSFEIIFESIFMRNDAGLKKAICSKRTIKLKNEKLTYSLGMSTDDLPQITNHLKVILKRVQRS